MVLGIVGFVPGQGDEGQLQMEFRWTQIGLSLPSQHVFHVVAGEAVPELTIVLNHIGGLLRVGPYADRDDEVVQYDG